MRNSAIQKQGRRPARAYAFLFLFILLAFNLHPSSFVFAQGQAEADLYPVDASAFPVMSSFLDVYDASARFISGLKPGDVSMIEDGKPLPVQQLTEMAVPAQIVIAINPGPSLAIRNTQGTPRFQAVVQALDAWGQKLPTDLPDDLSLVTIAGPIRDSV